MRVAGGAATSRGVTAAALAVAGLTLLANYASGSSACGTENSGCTQSPVRLWLGRVLTAEGGPVAGARVQYYFDSNRPKTSNRSTPVTVVSDAQGRYCLRWPTEASSVPVAVPARPAGRQLVVVSPDASGQPGGAYLIEGHVDPNVTVTNRGWRPAADATDACVTRSPPWNLLSIVLALAGAGRRRSTAIGRWATPASAALAATGALLYVLVWVTGSV
jgi:hypothetical protein